MPTQANTPIFTALKNYVDTKPTSFYMPGHKHGRGFPQDFIDYIPQIDITEIPGTDNLHFPEGIIKEAQELTAELFGAKHSFFLINGSSCGILATVMALCKHGDKLVVGRNCHKSVIAALTLAGAIPVYISPEYNEEYGISAHITPEAVKKALGENPDAKGVLITSPNFYGVCSDIREISKVCHQHKLPLIVDEAHGPHLKFHAKLPESAMEGGSDICIQSAHKTLLALTQASFLHVNSELINLTTLKHYLVMLQSTSPSYILIASLDIARQIVAEKGEKLLGELQENIDELKIKMKNLPKLSIADQNADVFNFDPTRIVVHSRKLGISGFELSKQLIERFNVYPELCDAFNVVFITTMDNNKADFEALFNALSVIHEENKNRPELPMKDLRLDIIPERAFLPKEAFEMKSERVSLSNAVGRISTAAVVPYPPGIPVLCPGEKISKHSVEYIQMILDLGGNVNNIDAARTIEVVA
ncbi:MAG: aminotransferase class I/II-fold pyridoxal phosphate-dependent enzyme [Chitinivibrionia bacterium]|nr:aminotransferase class I/II-fold pyridoxal phosphate-dependent enzyme [Chitinivibrionia bacterium]